MTLSKLEKIIVASALSLFAAYEVLSSIPVRVTRIYIGEEMPRSERRLPSQLLPRSQYAEMLLADSLRRPWTYSSLIGMNEDGRYENHFGTMEEFLGSNPDTVPRAIPNAIEFVLRSDDEGSVRTRLYMYPDPDGNLPPIFSLQYKVTLAGDGDGLSRTTQACHYEFGGSQLQNAPFALLAQRFAAGKMADQVLLRTIMERAPLSSECLNNPSVPSPRQTPTTYQVIKL